MKPPPSFPQRSTWAALVERALAEDLSDAGDRTSTAIFPPAFEARAVIEARQELVVCGLDIAAAVFETVDAELRFEAQRHDGERAAAGEALATISGRARSIFAAERTAVNFLMRLCGVATFTARFVSAVAGSRAEIVDTRKTLPGWRRLDKYAVAVGGGVNHRFGLHDGVLIKDNHIAAAGGVKAAVQATSKATPEALPIQVEVESLAQAEQALAAGADMLLLDNCSPAELRALVAALGERIPLEASGGVTLDNVAAIAQTGVQRISIGALTHSAPGADIALEVRGIAGNSGSGKVK